jgi:hypothetical protein
LLARTVEPSAAMKTVMSFMSALGCCLDNENELLVIYVGSEDRQRWGDGLKSIGFVGGLVGVQEWWIDSTGDSDYIGSPLVGMVGTNNNTWDGSFFRTDFHSGQKFVKTVAATNWTTGGQIET